jgi:hypothetical protein
MVPDIGSNGNSPRTTHGRRSSAGATPAYAQRRLEHLSPEPVNQRAGASEFRIAVDQNQSCVHFTVSASISSYSTLS